MISLDKKLSDAPDRILVQLIRSMSLMSSWFYDDKLSFSKIELFSGYLQTTLCFCPVLSFIKSGSTGEFIKC